MAMCGMGCDTIFIETKQDLREKIIRQDAKLLDYENQLILSHDAYRRLYIRFMEYQNEHN